MKHKKRCKPLVVLIKFTRTHRYVALEDVREIATKCGFDERSIIAAQIDGMYTRLDPKKENGTDPRIVLKRLRKLPFVKSAKKIPRSRWPSAQF